MANPDGEKLADVQAALAMYAEGYSDLVARIETVCAEAMSARPDLSDEAIPAGDPRLVGALAANRAVNELVDAIRGALHEVEW